MEDVAAGNHERLVRHSQRLPGFDCDHSCRLCLDDGFVASAVPLCTGALVH